MADTQQLLKKADLLTAKYEQHFKTKIPERIIGWWDPLNIASHPEELQSGLKAMEKDIDKAIKTNTPFKEIPKNQWNSMIF